MHNAGIIKKWKAMKLQNSIGRYQKAKLTVVKTYSNVCNLAHTINTSPSIETPGMMSN